MKINTPVIVTLSMLLISGVAFSQDQFRGELSAIPDAFNDPEYNFEMFTFVHRDFTNATSHGGGLWSGDIEEIIVRGVRRSAFLIR